MKAEWREQQSVVVFYPATPALVSYYAREGAVLDDGAHRRIKFDFRRPVDPRTRLSGDSFSLLAPAFQLEACAGHPVGEGRAVRRSLLL
jgi:hypothetical protein